MRNEPVMHRDRDFHQYGKGHFSDKHIEVMVYEFFESLLLEVEDFFVMSIVISILFYYWYVKCQGIGCAVKRCGCSGKEEVVYKPKCRKKKACLKPKCGCGSCKD